MNTENIVGGLFGKRLMRLFIHVDVKRCRNLNAEKLAAVLGWKAWRGKARPYCLLIYQLDV